MNYLLAVLTHGGRPTLTAALDSFAAHVQPAESDLVVVYDGADAFEHDRLRSRTLAPLLLSTRGPVGFCAATRRLWQAAADSDADYVFWLEHDFVFTRDVDLAQLAAVLDNDSALAQMALMRNAVNETEKAAGGLYESRPGQFVCRYLNTETGRSWEMPDPNPATRAERCQPWLEHSAYLTTNPSLMRREFMVENPWPDYADQCEGRFGIDLVARGYSFGVWGAGEPWVEHVGVRDGFGY